MHVAVQPKALAGPVATSCNLCSFRTLPRHVSYQWCDHVTPSLFFPSSAVFIACRLWHLTLVKNQTSDSSAHLMRLSGVLTHVTCADALPAALCLFFPRGLSRLFFPCKLVNVLSARIFTTAKVQRVSVPVQTMCYPFWLAPPPSAEGGTYTRSSCSSGPGPSLRSAGGGTMPSQEAQELDCLSAWPGLPPVSVPRTTRRHRRERPSSG